MPEQNLSTAVTLNLHTEALTLVEASDVGGGVARLHLGDPLTGLSLIAPLEVLQRLIADANRLLPVAEG
jgi:hypothetical protein